MSSLLKSIVADCGAFTVHSTKQDDPNMQILLDVRSLKVIPAGNKLVVSKHYGLFVTIDKEEYSLKKTS